MKTDRLSQLLAAGTIVGGRYRVQSHVASGGFGDVYSARHLVLESAVAIKVLRVERLVGVGASTHVAAFLDEARLLARLRHPHIVAVLDAGIVDETSQPWIALEWCEGRTLRDLIETDSRARSLEEAWELLAPIADSLAYAHDAGIIHRDVKPSNVLLMREGGKPVPKLVDFGIAKLMGTEIGSPDASQSRGASLGFSPAYAAPEQVTGSPTGPWTDIHALALLFVELVSGRDAYDRAYPLESAVSQDRPSLAELGVSSTPAIDAVVARALARDPRRRFASMRELQRAFEGALRSPPPRAATAALTPAPTVLMPAHAPVAPTLPVGRSLHQHETSPTSGAVARNATATHSPERSIANRVGLLSVVVVAATAMLGLTAWSRGWIAPRKEVASPPAIPTSFASSSASPLSSEAAPNDAVAPEPPSASGIAPVSSKVEPHRDRRLPPYEKPELMARVRARGFTLNFDSQTNAGPEVSIALTFQKGTCVGSLMYARILEHDRFDMLTHGIIPPPPSFCAFDGDSYLVIYMAGEGEDKCRNDLADAVAPRR